MKELYTSGITSQSVTLKVRKSMPTLIPNHFNIALRNASKETKAIWLAKVEVAIGTACTAPIDAACRKFL